MVFGWIWSWYVLQCFCLLTFFWCPCMAIDVVSVQYNDGLLPYIILLIVTQCYYHRRTRLYATKRLCFCSLWSHLNVLTFSPLTWGCSEGLGAFWFFLKQPVIISLEVQSTWTKSCRLQWNSQSLDMYGIYVCMVITCSRVWINRVRLPILLVVSWTGKNNIPLSPCVPENLVSRDGFSRPVPRQPAHLYTQAESGAYLRDSSRVPRRRPFMKPPYAIGSVPSLSGHAIA